MVKDKCKNNKGFTLVELLAVLAILSIVITIVITVSINVVNSSKEKSYKVTINNIEKEASNYALENSELLKWSTDGLNSEYEYQCVTVGHLIDKGYFKGDVLDSYVSKNQKVESDYYIYMERNKNNKTLDMSKLLYGDTGLDYYCSIDTVADISVKVVPVGKVVNNYCKEKDVTLTYRLRNTDDDILNYQYKYWDSFMKNKDETIYKTFDSYVMEKKVRFDKNGSIITSIGYLVGEDWNRLIPDESYEISGIDITGPIITAKKMDKTVRQEVTIPIMVNDSESGVNGNNDLEDKDLKVTIGDTDITDIELKKVDKNNYNLTVNDVLHEGLLKIVVAAESVDDNLGNPNKNTLLEPNITFSNKYKITFDGNKTNSSVTPTSMEVTYNKKVGTLPTATRSGFTFTEWNTKSDGSGTKYTSDTVYKNLKDITLYAQWKANTYNIEYDYAGGTKGANAPATGTYGKTINISKPTRSDYFFDGWVSSAADGLNASVARKGTSSDEDKLTSWDGSATDATYFRNLSSTDGATVTLTATWYQDTEKPTCTISKKAGSTTLTGSAKDNKGIASQGWSKKYDNDTTLNVTVTGTKTYYVKDTSGNVGSCSVKVVATDSYIDCGDYSKDSSGNCYTTKSSTKRCYCDTSLGGTNSQSKTFTPDNEEDCIKTCRLEYERYVYTANYCASGTYSSSLGKCKIIKSGTKKYKCDSGYTKLSNSFCAK